MQPISELCVCVCVCVCVFVFSRAAPTVHRCSRARGLTGAVTASLHHSHSNATSKPCLRPSPQLTATPDPNPLSEARDQTRNLMITSWIRFHCATAGTPSSVNISLI